MLRHVVFLGAVVLLAGAPLLQAQEPGQRSRPAAAAAQAEGTLMMGDKTYKMTHAAAYESNFDGEADVFMIVLSNQPIRPEKIKEVKAGEKDGNTYDYPRPFMKLEFTKDGKLLSWSGGAGNHSAGRGTLVTNIKSELKIGTGRLAGSASQPNEKGGAFSTGFDVRFDVALPGVTSQKPGDKPAVALPASPPTVKPRAAPPASPKPAAGTANIKDLPLPKDATNVEYHKEAELVTLASPSNVKTAAAELTKGLKAQGWDADGGDIVTPLSALVKRKRGSATLEIIITPADLVNTDKGCELKIVTTGLSWEGK